MRALICTRCGAVGEYTATDTHHIAPAGWASIRIDYCGVPKGKGAQSRTGLHLCDTCLSRFYDMIAEVEQ